jgi:hypothetical protein
MNYNKVLKNNSGNCIFTPAIIFTENDLHRLLINNGTNLITDLDFLRVKIKKELSYSWDSSIGYVKNDYGDLFTFSLDRYGFTVWSLGGTTLFRCPVVDDHNEMETYLSGLSSSLYAYSKGLVSCSNCGKMCEQESVKNNHYWAGVYCQDCWDLKFEKLALKERYD